MLFLRILKEIAIHIVLFQRYSFMDFAKNWACFMTRFKEISVF
jgi:hypothetical protein